MAASGRPERPAWLTDDALRDIVERCFRFPDPDPATDDEALALYLWLPIDHRGRRFRSCLETLVEDTKYATGWRTNPADPPTDPRRGTLWLGNFGFLALFDQLGKAVAKPNGSATLTPFERAVVDFAGETPDTAAALYALRNSLAHSYGLVNKNAADRSYLFSVDAAPSLAGGPIVELPNRPWEGDPDQIAGRQTDVHFRALGVAALRALDEVRRLFAAGDLGLAPGMTAALLRRSYVFAHGIPSDRRHDRDTLVRMIGHVGYEGDQMLGALRTLGDTTSTHNAALESVLTHVRNVDDFLGRSGGAPSDVFAADYLPTWSPRFVLTAEERRNVNRKLAHIATDRLDAHDGWNLAGLVDRCAVRFREFLEQLADEDPDMHRRFLDRT